MALLLVLADYFGLICFNLDCRLAGDRAPHSAGVCCQLPQPGQKAAMALMLLLTAVLRLSTFLPGMQATVPLTGQMPVANYASMGKGYNSFSGGLSSSSSSSSTMSGNSMLSSSSSNMMSSGNVLMPQMSSSGSSSSLMMPQMSSFSAVPKSYSSSNMMMTGGTTTFISGDDTDTDDDDNMRRKLAAADGFIGKGAVAAAVSRLNKGTGMQAPPPAQPQLVYVPVPVHVPVPVQQPMVVLPPPAPAAKCSFAICVPQGTQALPQQSRMSSGSSSGVVMG
jgi:hypothetical protein